MIKAIIMAGGEGTRLRPLTCNRAKPMIPVINKPVIEHAVDLLKKHKIYDIIISLFYLPENIQNYFGDGSEWGVNITYSVEENPLGTAGGVKQAIANHNDTFIVLSGDGIINFDITKILKFHKQKKSPFTIMLTRVKEPTEYGIVITDEEGKIEKFLEKPSWSEVFTDTANTGMYVIEPKILNKYVPAQTKFDFSFDLFPLLQKNKIDLYGYIEDGYWCDVGNIHSYRQVHYDILDGLVDLETSHKTIAKDVWVGKNVEIDPEANIKGPVLIGDFVKIKKGADISDFTVLGNNCIIEEGASIRRSIVLHSTIIGPKSEIRGAVIGKRCVLEEHVEIYENAVISDDCQIDSNSKIHPGIRVWPDKFIEQGVQLTSDLIWGQTEKKSVFTADGLYGSFNVKITPEFASKLGAALGAYLGIDSRVVISRDASAASRIIKRGVTSGLLSMGIDVFDMEIESMPVTRYSTRFINADIGIHVQITPLSELDYIKIRLFDKNGFYLNNTILKKIENIFLRGDFPRKSAYEVGNLHFPTHHIESYISNSTQYINPEIIRPKEWNLILDCFNGSASYIFPDLLAYYGCIPTVLRGQLKYMNNKSDIKNETRKALDHIQKMCKANKEIGIMIGPNAEYIVIIDESGEIINADKINALLCLYYLKHQKTKSINIPVTASGKIEELAKTYKGNIKRISTQNRSPYSSEDIFRETKDGRFPFLELDYDPMITFLIILEFASLENKKLYELNNEIPEINISRVAIPCSPDEKASIMRELSEISEGEKIELLDGLRIVREDSWILILPDATQPIIHLYGEGKTIEERDAIIKEYTVKIKSFSRLAKL
jgi:mannose-1-phosphate guanylyltransferase/phosphomannomutase